jgi:primosomal protein N''
MNKTLKNHIAQLEQKIESLKAQLAASSRSSKKDLRFDLGIAEQSLALFRKAYDLERKNSN